MTVMIFVTQHNFEKGPGISISLDFTHTKYITEFLVLVFCLLFVNGTEPNFLFKD